jgi:hypothetical protein
METEPSPASIRLLEALVQWSDPGLVEAVHRAESEHTAYELIYWKLPKLSEQSQWRQPKPGQVGDPAHVQLRLAWDALDRDFRMRIETGAMFLEGVEVTDDHDAQPQALRGAFAAEFKFDFALNTLSLGKRRFSAITVSRTPGPSASTKSPLPPAEWTRPLKVDDLTDDEILDLLEENARRVLADPTVKLFPPGKLTVMPLIRGKMRHRAGQAELLSTLAAEADWLHKWASSRVELHFVPAVPTIKKVLNKEYEVLKARSKAAIQNLKS